MLTILTSCRFAGLDQYLLPHLFMVRLEIPGSSLWGKKEPEAQRLPCRGGCWAQLWAYFLGSLLDGLDVGRWVPWSMEQQVIHFLHFRFWFSFGWTYLVSISSQILGIPEMDIHPGSYKTGRRVCLVSRQLMMTPWGKHQESWDVTGKAIKLTLW